MRIALIVNPGAGGTRRRRLEHVLAVLREEGGRVETLRTTAPGHAIGLAREAAQSGGFDRVAAAGGDGTINEVAEGLRGCDVPLAIVPLGSANVLAREAGIPLDPGAAARVCLAGHVTNVFPGLVRCPPTGGGAPEGSFFDAGEGRRRFLLMVGIGIDGAVARGVTPGWKRLLGRGAFAAAALRVFLRRWAGWYHAHSPDRSAEGASVVVANAARYAGPWILDPEAGIHRYGLRVCVFPGRRRLDILRYAVSLLLGRLAHARDVIRFPVEQVEVRCAEGAAPAPVQVDGEAAGRCSVIEAMVDPEPLRLVVPSP